MRHEDTIRTGDLYFITFLNTLCVIKIKRIALIHRNDLCTPFRPRVSVSLIPDAARDRHARGGRRQEARVQGLQHAQDLIQSRH